MKPERWRQIEQLYHAARERAPADRAALLAQAEPEVRREVEAMLAQDGSGKILDEPAKDLLTDSGLTTLAAGSQLGPYQIEVMLGSGGMGKVYRAVDTRLDRKVAIKISSDQFSCTLRVPKVLWHNLHANKRLPSLDAGWKTYRLSVVFSGILFRTVDPRRRGGANAAVAGR